jgi:ferric-dicitrate binding protein FerR (iron transport regulator)
MQEKFDFLIKRHLTNEISPQEREQLLQLINEHEDLRQLYQTLYARNVSETDGDKVKAQQAYASHFAQMQINNAFKDEAEIEQEQAAPVVVMNNWRRNLIWAAATVLLVASLSFLYWQKQGNIATQSLGNVVATKKGSKSQVTLPDGTRVWLNADSRLAYVGDFQGAIREISLTGEAFFDVAKDPKRPFVIHANSIDIKVLGTVFNLRSYAGESTTETALLHGKIEVTLHNQPDNKIILKPNEKLIVSNAITNDNSKNTEVAKEEDVAETPMLTLSKIRYVSKDSLPTEAYWVQNKLAFDNETFEKVASKIERWYNVEVVIRNEQLKEQHYTGYFEGNTLEDVMEALHISGGLNFKIKPGKVIVE